MSKSYLFGVALGLATAGLAINAGAPKFFTASHLEVLEEIDHANGRLFQHQKGNAFVSKTVGNVERDWSVLFAPDGIIPICRRFETYC